MKEILKRLMEHSDPSVQIPISSQTYDIIAAQVILSDTGVDLSDAITSGVDADTNGVFTVIDEDALSEEDAEKLGSKYNFNEWYEVTNSIMYTLFGGLLYGVFITGDIDLGIYYINISLTLYNSLYDSQNLLNKPVYRLSGEDVLMVLEDMDQEALYKDQEIFEDLLSFIHRNMEIPWTEYIEVMVDSYVDGRVK